MSRRLRGVLAAATVALLAIGGSLAGAAPASAAPGPPDAQEWWFDSWNVPALWAVGADGRGITVAVVDTGVQASIPELAGKVLPGTDYTGNGSDGRTDFDGDDFSHGTAMASLIVASKGVYGIEGLAPQAKILPIAIPLEGTIRTGAGAPNPNSTALAVRYAADHGAKIISMSLGGIRNPDEDEVPCPPALQAAVVYALTKGSLVVAASGNSGDSGSPVEEPGVCLGAVSVGAIDATLAVAPYSSRHSYLTVSAPGDAIATLSRQSGTAFVGDGTSQATAITSAALALIWSKYPTATNKQILSRLLSTVVDKGPKGRDPAYGIGVINTGAAVRSGIATAPDPVFDGVQPLLAQAAAKPISLAGKAPAGNAQAPIGSVVVAGQARVLGSSFYLLAAVAVAALLAALAFVLLAIRRRAGPAPATLAPNL
ncbi:MAG: peptidase [Frankiales bacterium]|nr:peptidase [Frankiales bacterium]